VPAPEALSLAQHGLVRRGRASPARLRPGYREPGPGQMVEGEALGLVPEGLVCRVQVRGHRAGRELVLVVQAEVAGQVGLAVPAAGGQAGGWVGVGMAGSPSPMPRSTARQASSGVLPPDIEEAAAFLASRPRLAASAVMLAAGAEGCGWRACQADQNSSSSSVGAMKTSVPRPGGQVR